MLRISSVFPQCAQSVPLKCDVRGVSGFRKGVHGRSLMNGMLRSTILALLGAFLIAGSPSTLAIPIFDPPAVEAGRTTTAMADFGITGPGYFDLLLNVPDKFELLQIFDDESDDTIPGVHASYNRFVDDRFFGGTGSGVVFDSNNSFPGAVFSSLFPSGRLGIRATDFTNGAQGFAKIKLKFKVLDTTPLDTYTINYQYRLNDGNLQTSSFDIRVFDPNAVPEPELSVLLLSGIGVLIAARRRRRV